MDPSLTAALAQRPVGSQVGEAAVAVVLVAHSHELLLIRRAEHPGDPWSGHMALPGGHKDPGDADLLATAVRETREETGVDLAAARLLGELELVAAQSRAAPSRRVVPYAFELAERPRTTPNHEVAEIVWTPLSDLAGGKLDSHFPFTHQGQQYRFPAWDLGQERIVWGLTHRILRQLLTVIE